VTGLVLLALAVGAAAASDGGAERVNPPEVLPQKQADQIPRGTLVYPSPAANQRSTQLQRLSAR
jgi:hypothetical protein